MNHRQHIGIIMFLVVTILLSSSMPSYSFRLGDADPMINNIWLEPKNPKPGEPVSIHSSIYNLGTHSTKEVVDTLTIGYLIDGELVKIDTLVNVPPGADNGIKITTGPIWKATQGIHTITVILNYHDMLSHLTDNLENNIMQKKYYIGDWQNSSQPLISFEIFQKAIPDTENQIVKIEGRIELPKNYPDYRVPKIGIEINGENIIQKYSAAIDRDSNTFYWRETIPISRTIVPITVSFEDERYQNFDYDYTSYLYPVNLKHGESLFVLRLLDSTDVYNFKNQNFDVIVYDELYNIINKYETSKIIDYPIKKVESIQLPASPFTIEEPPPKPNPEMSTNMSGDLLYVILPGQNTYHFEVYSDNGLEYASIKFLEDNKIQIDTIKNKNTHQIELLQNESLLSLNLHDPTNSYTFQNSTFVLAIFQDSYDNLLKKISAPEYDNESSISDGNLLTILPAGHQYIVEMYLDGIFLTAFEDFFSHKSVISKTITIPELTKVQFEIVDESGTLRSDDP